MSSDEPLLHFGLGDQSKIDELRIRWPGGKIQTHQSLPADMLHIIAESAESVPSSPDKSPSREMFVDVAVETGLDFTHQEQNFDDYESQPLLPYKLSQLGPGMAWGDANGDGWDDVFVGGAANQAGQLFVADGDGRFHPLEGPWIQDAHCEDMGVAWLDIDIDGDLDLYVVSGGVEAGDATQLYQDRVYLNQGKGEFRRATDTVPEIIGSGGPVAVADFDQDGDLDLFVGGRVVPGKYPTAPRSYLLRNDGGKLVDATDEVAPGLKDLGMITAAQWSDFNNDGKSDLVVAVEWGPITLFINESPTKLVNRTRIYGLADTKGWWNGICSGDLDNDGDLDLVATNAGYNTKYHASREEPARIFYGNFDSLVGASIIESYYEGAHQYPVRGRSSSIAAMPSLATKFPTFRDFAKAEIEDIIDQPSLEQSQRLEANELGNLAFINDGNGRFTSFPLPPTAQLSPGFGVQIVDVDADGLQDVYVVQNFHFAST